ncbi:MULTISPECIES: amidase family protein [Enterobacterales]|uniref:amidase family protein n=1 Tax=Enterobacterales TaxID=91347 RepID=UPI002EDA7C34
MEYSGYSARVALQTIQLSAVELAQQTLVRIERDNPQVNVFTEVTTARMLAEAAEVDAKIANGEALPPLAGVSCAVKNRFDIEGITTLAGAKLFSEAPPALGDAFAIRQRQQALVFWHVMSVKV